MPSWTESSLVMKLGATTTNRNPSNSQRNGITHTLRHKKFRSQRSADKAKLTVFWHAQGIITLDFREPWAHVNFERYVKTLIKAKARIARTRSAKKTFFLQHDNARSHASLKTTEGVTKFGWRVLSHLPYSPNLAPSNFHLFVALKHGLRGQHFADNNAVIDAVKKFTATAGREFYQQGIQVLVYRWKNVLKMMGTT